MNVTNKLKERARDLFEVNNLLKEKDWLGKGVVETKMGHVLDIAIVTTITELVEYIERRTLDLQEMQGWDKYDHACADVIQILSDIKKEYE